MDGSLELKKKKCTLVILADYHGWLIDDNDTRQQGANIKLRYITQ